MDVCGLLAWTSALPHLSAEPHVRLGWPASPQCGLESLGELCPLCSRMSATVFALANVRESVGLVFF